MAPLTNADIDALFSAGNRTTSQDDAAQMAERREQRRYEIARDLFVALMPHKQRNINEIANYTVGCADVLLAELERMK